MTALFVDGEINPLVYTLHDEAKKSTVSVLWGDCEQPVVTCLKNDVNEFEIMIPRTGRLDMMLPAVYLSNNVGPMPFAIKGWLTEKDIDFLLSPLEPPDKIEEILPARLERYRLLTKRLVVDGFCGLDDKSRADCVLCCVFDDLTTGVMRDLHMYQGVYRGLLVVGPETKASVVFECLALSSVVRAPQHLVDLVKLAYPDWTALQWSEIKHAERLSLDSINQSKACIRASPLYRALRYVDCDSGWKKVLGILSDCVASFPSYTVNSAVEEAAKHTSTAKSRPLFRQFLRDRFDNDRRHRKYLARTMSGYVKTRAEFA